MRQGLQQPVRGCGHAFRLAGWLLFLLCVSPLWAEAPPDRAFSANAIIAEAEIHTDATLGDAQGVTLRDGKIYLYGDVSDAHPRVGVVREYDMQLKPTGRVVWLRRDGKPLLRHPTGLTADDRWGTFLGDTVNQKAKIYRFDWEQMWRDGNLDHSVRDEIDDDDAVNGCRPEFVAVAGRPLLASADYGDVHPELRLYDPELMLKFHRTSARA